MSISRIASRYAKSLMDISIERKAVEETYQDILAFEGLLENRDFHNMLRSPVVPTARKADIFKGLFQGKLSEITYGFFMLVIKKGREIIFPEIVKEFIKQYQAKNNIVTVRLITAVQLDEAGIEMVKKMLLNKKVIEGTINLQTKVNPKIIGGFQIEFTDKLIDASIKHKLDVMRRELAINLYESKIRSI